MRQPHCLDESVDILLQPGQYGTPTKQKNGRLANEMDRVSPTVDLGTP